MSATPGSVLIDPLEYLPVSTLLEVRKGRAIYGPDQPPSKLYLVIDGWVKVSRLAHDGSQVVVDIYQEDSFFGESALVGQTQPGEFAVSLHQTKLMTWTVAPIEEIAARNAKLALALMQLIIRRSVEFCNRIEGFGAENIARRLARGLILFSERFGTPIGDGFVQMLPFTHELLAQYVGTSREIVTQHMNLFRRQGHLRYSRQGILVYPDAMNDAVLAGVSATVENVREMSAQKGDRVISAELAQKIA